MNVVYVLTEITFQRLFNNTSVASIYRNLFSSTNMFVVWLI